MEIKVARRIDKDGRYVSEITIPEELWGYADILRSLTDDLAGAGFHFQDPQEELRIQRPRITLFSWGPGMSLTLSEITAVTFGVEKTLEWITKEKVELNATSFLPSEWQEGEFSIPIPLKEVPA